MNDILYYYTAIARARILWSFSVLSGRRHERGLGQHLIAITTVQSVQHTISPPAAAQKTAVESIAFSVIAILYHHLSRYAFPLHTLVLLASRTPMLHIIGVRTLIVRLSF